jgi:hypothetical protein
VNEELRELYEADQGDRLAGEMPPDVVERDRARRRRVAELLDAGAGEAGEDYFHAAMVFQHGEDLGDYQRAHELALRAAELGHRAGRWLAAAAYDRWLMNQGKPQKYGTQYRGVGDRYELYEVDPATTDAERAEWDVPPLAEALRHAEDMLARMPRRVAGGFALGAPAVTFRAGDLELQIHVVPASSGPPPQMPAPTPLQDGDPVPSWLPPGLTAARVQQGFGAVDEAGELRIGWSRPTVPMVMGWREQDGPPPQPEAVEVGGGTGILCQAVEGWLVLVLGRPDGQRWMVGGKGTREELLRVAESLP